MYIDCFNKHVAHGKHYKNVYDDDDMTMIIIKGVCVPVCLGSWYSELNTWDYWEYHLQGSDLSKAQSELLIFQVHITDLFNPRWPTISSQNSPMWPATFLSWPVSKVFTII